jgi:hypothetical protein
MNVSGLLTSGGSGCNLHFVALGGGRKRNREISTSFGLYGAGVVTNKLAARCTAGGVGRLCSKLVSLDWNVSVEIIDLFKLFSFGFALYSIKTFISLSTSRFVAVGLVVISIAFVLLAAFDLVTMLDWVPVECSLLCFLL